jgi:hypothetical protein
MYTELDICLFVADQALQHWVSHRVCRGCPQGSFFLVFNILSNKDTKAQFCSGIQLAHVVLQFKYLCYVTRLITSKVVVNLVMTSCLESFV